MGRNTITIRPAAAGDIETLCSLDLIARREFIERSVVAGDCHIADDGGEVIGYGVLSHAFYDQGFVEMLYVDPDRRRCGAGRALLLHMESFCRTSKLFTSTNLSNLPMQSLLNQAGYGLSGVIHNLDEGDPELVYFKRLMKVGPR